MFSGALSAFCAGAYLYIHKKEKENQEKLKELGQLEVVYPKEIEVHEGKKIPQGPFVSRLMKDNEISAQESTLNR